MVLPPPGDAGGPLARSHVRMRALHMLLALSLVAILPVAMTAPAAANPLDVPLVAAVDSAVASFSGSAAVVITDPRSGATYAHGDGRVFTAASLYKLGVMVEAYRAAAAGELALDGTTVTIADEDLVDDGEETDSGTTLTVREAVERMITVSDNSCARALLRLLDTHRVNATSAALGLTATRINTTLPDAEQTAPMNTISAHDAARLFTALVNGTVVSPAASAEMLAILGRQRINDRLPAGLPDGTPIAHKTGNLDGVAHDAGVITTPFGPRVVVVLTDGFADYADVVALAAAVAHDAYTLPLDRFAAAIAPAEVSRIVPGQAYRAVVNVTNTSTFTWDPTFHLASHWRNESGAYVRWDGRRAELPPLAPGQSATVEFHGVAPLSTEPLGVLEFDVVHENVAWAGTPVRIVVTFASAAP